MTPLEALAAALFQHGDPAIARKVFGAYDQFLGILLDSEQREELAQLPLANALESRVWRAARDASHDFRDGLDDLFLKKQSLVSELTLRFGLF
jgi:hypothetical protein